jgi:protein gp37
MGESTGIEWTHHTFNPWWGCVRVSPGCEHCYAETAAKRYGHNVWGVQAGRRFFGEKHWAEPVKWNAKAKAASIRRRVFCASMADVFESNRDLDEQRARLWPLIEATPSLDWQLLTKRPENVARLVPPAWMSDWPVHAWLGFTAESQEYFNARYHHVRSLPAHVIYCSYEPALGPIDVGGAVRLSWLIAGAESGHGARPMAQEWVRAVKDQCVALGIAFFYKQDALKGRKIHTPELDGRQWLEFPASASGKARLG